MIGPTIATSAASRGFEAPAHQPINREKGADRTLVPGGLVFRDVFVRFFVWKHKLPASL